MAPRIIMRVCVWLLAPLLLAQLSLPTVVLCRGADGHVELEWSHAGQCAPYSAPSGRAEIADRGHCGECFDSLISISDPLNHSRRAVTNIAPPTMATPPEAMTTSFPPTRLYTRPESRSPRFISPPALRSVVLLL
ncbi:MAG: hypothetical protein ABGY41_22770 [Candidatus Poribacteria bacterium]